jgi:hypothetical protein
MDVNRFGMGRMRCDIPFVVLSTILIAAQATAQGVRGVVRDSAVGNPLGGAIVQLLDSAGAGRARSITDVDGRFVLPATPAVATLRIMRIGYRPVERPLSGDTDVAIDVAMSHVPPILDAVRVRGSKLCPGSPERGAAFEIWQQARSGLLATVVGRDLKPAQATTLAYTTTLAPNDARVLRQTKNRLEGRATRPFIASATPSFFARVGYMIEDGSSRIYYAPDADVLIDESFAATHCFQLRRADGAHPGQVGLAFEPIAGRDALVDVEGVVWVDAATPQLRSLDFVYTSLEPAAMDAGAGGHIEFQTMRNGLSVIVRWHLRLASLQLPAGGVPRSPSAIATMRRTDLTEARLKEIVETGGVVLEAAWPDGTAWKAERAAVSGVVVRKRGGDPAVGAIVDLAGTPDTVRTDSAGKFRLETLPGKYVLEASDTTLATFVEPRTQSRTVELRLGADATTRLEVAAIDDVVRELCRDQPMPAGSTLMVGSIVSAAGRLPRDAVVEATMQQILSASSVRATKQTISLDDRGRFVVCGAPQDRQVHLRLQASDSAIADTAVVVPLGARMHQVRWVIPPR